MAWDRLASADVLRRTIAALEGHGIRVVHASTPEGARNAVLDIIPPKAEVFNATSTTFDELGLTKEILESGRYQALRKHLDTVPPEERRALARRHFATPEWVTGSVHAITEDGKVVVVSQTGSQLGPYATGAHHVVWVAGTHKIVPDLAAAFRRIAERSVPMEDDRARKAYGKGTALNKMLVVQGEATKDRITLVLVDAVLGF